jgi:hypothetical protein
VIFDAVSRQIVRQIDLPSNVFSVAAGLQKFVVFLPAEVEVRRYDLASGKLEATAPFSSCAKLGARSSRPPQPTSAMGAASHGPVAVTMRNTPTYGVLDLYDLETLKPLEWSYPEEFRSSDSSQHMSRERRPWRPAIGGVFPTSLRASADGSTFTGWDPSMSSSNIWKIDAAATATTAYAYESQQTGDDVGYILPSADGSKFVTGRGVMSANLTPRLGDPSEAGQASWLYAQSSGRYELAGRAVQKIVFLPAQPGSLLLGVTTPRVARPGPLSPTVAKEQLGFALYADSSGQPVAELPPCPELPSQPSDRGFSWYTREQTGQDLLDFDQRIFCLLDQRMMVVIPSAGPESGAAKIVWHALPEAAQTAAATAALGVASLPDLLARKGTAWSYRPRFVGGSSEIEAALISGPAGMTLAAGALAWAVPADATEGPVGVIVGLRDAEGHRAFHSFRLIVR